MSYQFWGWEHADAPAITEEYPGIHNPRQLTLLFSSCTLTLVNEEFIKFLTELNEIATKYMSIPVTKTSVSRQIILVSSPGNL